MRPSRRQFLRFIGAATAVSAAPRSASALNYPTRPVRFIVPFAPAGTTDIAARLIGQWLSERLGQQFVVENHPGAGTSIGTEVVVNAPADGHTLLLAPTAGAVNATLYEKLKFNFVRDIAPVAGIFRVPLLVEVNRAFRAKTIPQFVAYAKANPGKVSMASSGVGTSLHVAGELFKMMTGVNLVHVPYRGEAPAITDLLGGQVDVMFGTTPLGIEHIRSGRLRALAVTTATRSEALPEIPTVAEFLPGYEASAWFGVGAPRNLPPEIVDRLNGEINAALADSKIKARIAELGGMALAGSPAEFGKLIVDETEKWANVVKFAGIKAR